jgi:hypothetical protein
MSDSISLRIDPTELRHETTEQGGIKVITSPSPYDIPDAMVIDFDKGTKQISLNFKYLSSEPIRLIDENGVTFGLGRNSSRLYGVTVDVQSLAQRAADTATDIVNLIDQRLDALWQDKKNDSDSYEVAEKAVSMERDELMERFNNILSQINTAS